ncbi:uracil-DNA glycosylase family protein [Halopenitus persicus]|uniref:uracil-DNA glycosylase family protein n=1 Tax=Halopenitus persicus TaxID=1048396 RepID=UPI000BBB5BDF|nr:uracil-DNA glycosylase family protein [Halopenitus persicus]
MRNVTDRRRNPFGMRPDCAEYVPGYGDANADFHVIGDHPGVHGGRESGVPFADEPWSERFFGALRDGGIIGAESAIRNDGASGDAAIRTDGRSGAVPWAAIDGTFLSYLHACVPNAGSRDPSDAAYAELEPIFDAELRAIAAHVLLPVGERATRHVIESYTAKTWAEIEGNGGLEVVHGTELLGSGWLVVPIRDPREWGADHADRLAAGLRELRRTDYRRESDLGRFIAGEEPYFVR